MVVLKDGAVIAELTGDDVTEDRLLQAIAAAPESDAALKTVAPDAAAIVMPDAASDAVPVDTTSSGGETDHD